MTSPVLIVGAGISGLACARALGRAGLPVHVVERGRVVGGRMATRRLEGRLVDLGAAFFTADLASPFGAVVNGWLDRELARPWTDSLSVSEPGHPLVTKAGPLRYAAPGGLRSLVADLAVGLGDGPGGGLGGRPVPGSGHGAAVDLEHPIDAAEADAAIHGGEFSAVVLAMPDPQARRLLPATSPVHARLSEAISWAPTIAVALGWPERVWAADFHGAFVNGSPILSFVADDGDRRGDGAAVLVAHSSAESAREHLEVPDAAIPSITEAVRALLELADAPSWSYAHRWTFARPLVQHPQPFLLEDGSGAPVGVCGDGWGGTSSVGTAWTSGDALGRALAERLA